MTPQDSSPEPSDSASNSLKTSPDSLKTKMYREFVPSARQEPGVSTTNCIISVLIVVSVILAIIESEPFISAAYERVLFGLELVIGLCFLSEYCIRVWVSSEDPKYPSRWAYIRSPGAIFDFIALSPVFFLGWGSEAYMIRLIRLARILRLARLGRFSAATRAISVALLDRRYELCASLAIAGVLMLISATLLHVVEGQTQPDAFGSILRSMWWAIATLTTVGYGDVYPVTILGKLIAGLTAIFGIGLIAMPTGILAAAFSNALQEEREKISKRPRSKVVRK